MLPAKSDALENERSVHPAAEIETAVKPVCSPAKTVSRLFDNTSRTAKIINLPVRSETGRRRTEAHMRKPAPNPRPAARLCAWGNTAAETVAAVTRSNSNPSSANQVRPIRTANACPATAAKVAWLSAHAPARHANVQYSPRNAETSALVAETPSRAILPTQSASTKAATAFPAGSESIARYASMNCTWTIFPLVDLDPATSEKTCPQFPFCLFIIHCLAF